MAVLTRGDACLQCRRRKVKCDGLKPSCSLCQRLGKQCTYANGITRRRLTDALEARTVQLELQVRKATIASSHDLFLISARLIERSGRLGSLNNHAPIDIPCFPISLQPGQESSASDSSKGNGRILKNGAGYSPVVSIDSVEHQLAAYQWAGYDELPTSLSHHLVSLFLPYRSQYFFFVDLPHFLGLLSLPSSDPDAIHPCLLNACYLGACAGSQGMLASLQPFFVKRTRHFLNQALMFADRITHFLWASILLSAYFGRSRRLEEAFVVISPAARLASACGLDRLVDANGTNEDTGLYLLPPPRNVGEMVDRLRLAHSIYITDQTLYILSGYPTTFKYDGRWGSPQEKTSTTPDRERTATENDALAEVWHSDMHLKVSIARIFERVSKFALLCCANGCSGKENEYKALCAEISSRQKSLPPLSDPRGLQPSEAVSTFNPHLILAHTTLYGSGLILWSLRAHEDIQAKDKLLECLQALVRICGMMRGPRPRSRVQGAMLSMLHIRNAVRVLTRELQQAEVRANTALSMSYYTSVEYLLDFLDDMVLLYPDWVDVPMSLKDTLLLTATSLTSA